MQKKIFRMRLSGGIDQFKSKDKCLREHTRKVSKDLSELRALISHPGGAAVS